MEELVVKRKEKENFAGINNVVEWRELESCSHKKTEGKKVVPNLQQQKNVAEVIFW